MRAGIPSAMARKSKKNKPLPDDEPPLAEPGEPLASEAVGSGDADFPEIIPDSAEEEKPGEQPPESKEPAPLEEPGAIPDITTPDSADETRTPEEDEEPGPDMPPYEPAPLAREPLVKPGTLFLLALIIGGGGLLFYQNLEMARSTAELKESLAKIENRLESLASEKMDEKSGVMIAQAVKTLKEDVRILKERQEEPATPPVPEPTADAPEAEIAVDPRLLEGDPEDEGESEKQAEAEAPQVAAVTPPAVEEKEVPAEEPASEAAGEKPEAAKATPEAAEAAPEAEGGEEAEAPEDEADDEEPEPAKTQPKEANEEEPEVVEAPPAEAPTVEEQAERTPVVRDYLNFIEDSARKFSRLLQSGLDRLREVFSG